MDAMPVSARVRAQRLRSCLAALLAIALCLAATTLLIRWWLLGARSDCFPDPEHGLVPWLRRLEPLGPWAGVGRCSTSARWC